MRSSSAFDPFGALRATADAADTFDPFGFGGQHGYYTDPETGLSLLTHRYYDAGAGRFVTRDPIGYTGGINLYGFAGNNPVNESDPSGFDPGDPGEGELSMRSLHPGMHAGTAQSNMARQMMRDEVNTLRDVPIGIATGGVGGEAEEAVAVSLSGRQRGILEQMAHSGSEALMHKRAVSMSDLRQLTKHTGDEFAMFTRGSQRLIMRGSGGAVPPSMMNGARAAEMAKAGWRFSGHTHTPGYAPEASEGDRAILRAFGQRRSGIWATSGRSKPFYATIADEFLNFIRRF